MRTIQCKYQFIHQVFQKSREPDDSCVTKKFTCAAPLWFSEQYMHAVFRSNLEVLGDETQGGSITISTLIKLFYFH